MEIIYLSFFWKVITYTGSIQIFEACDRTEFDYIISKK